MDKLEKLIQKYLRASHKCLNCGSGNIEGDSVQVDAGGASQEVTCKECGSEWTDLYSLTDVYGITIHNYHLKEGKENGKDVVAGSE